MSKHNFDTETLELNDTDVLLEDKRVLMLYNDDFNTFDFVIESLIDVCEHDFLQAEQCTHIVHYNGKCDVKVGTYDDLKPMNKELQRRGLSSVIK